MHRKTALVATLTGFCWTASMLSPADAGSRLYDMNRLLSQPHPLAGQTVPRPVPGPVSVPTPRPRAVPNTTGSPNPFAGAQIAPRPVLRPASGAVYRPAPVQPFQSQEIDGALTAGADPLWGVVREARLGLWMHSVGLFSSDREDGYLVNPEIQFTTPNFLKFLFNPRPTIGGQINTSSDATEYVYGGLNWRMGLWGNFHFDIFLGLGVQFGHIEDVNNDRIKFGCRWLVRQNYGIGYKFGERHRVSINFDHYSHGSICSTRNQGVDNIGITYGYTF